MQRLERNVSGSMPATDGWRLVFTTVTVHNSVSDILRSQQLSGSYLHSSPYWKGGGENLEEGVDRVGAHEDTGESRYCSRCKECSYFPKLLEGERSGMGYLLNSPKTSDRCSGM
jgi:hypothetical protein